MTRRDVSADALVLATRSTHKVVEIRDILAPMIHLDIVSLDDAGIEEVPDEDAIEVHDTFLDNAHAKAEYFLRLTGRATIADDSGISVDALHGAPGVRSRRFALDGGLTEVDSDRANNDRANNERLLRELQHVPPQQRTAHYTCAAVLHLPDGRRFSALGTCSGSITSEPRGDGGFGYDPLFLLAGLERTFAELSPAMKHRYSHRARAFRALAAALPVLDHRALFR